MGLSLTTTIFLFVICLCGGIVIGAMFSRYKKAPPGTPEAQEKEEEEEQKPAPVEISIAQPGDTEVLRAWRNGSNKVWLEMDGLRLETRDDLRAEQKKDLFQLVLDLRPWLDAAAAPPPRPQVQEIPPAEVLLPVEEPRVKPLKLFSRPPKAAKVPAADAKPAVNMKSIVEQIDEVLQEKLVATPFASLKIRLLEGPGGEVNVQIGAVTHPGVDAIPNPEIQALIRQATAEWEKRAR